MKKDIHTFAEYVESISGWQKDGDIYDPSDMPEEVRQELIRRNELYMELIGNQEELRDSGGNLRGSVYAKEVRYAEVEGYWQHPRTEFFYDLSGNVRGFKCPKNYSVRGGAGRYAIFWNIEREEYEKDAPYLALLKFSESGVAEEIDPNADMPPHVLDGKYDRVIELPTPEGMLFFDSFISDVVIESKPIAERVMKEGLRNVRHYAKMRRMPLEVDE
ncbi:MAG: hypothetical protein LBC38_00175 [Oscillospiraceae bacterium]|nr:hypothetical protein [Oscillospiraceae bacterium]